MDNKGTISAVRTAERGSKATTTSTKKERNFMRLERRRLSGAFVTLRIPLFVAAAVFVGHASAVRSPSHDALFGSQSGFGSQGGAKRERVEQTAFNTLPKPLAGLDRLGRQSCISKHGPANCMSGKSQACALPPLSYFALLDGALFIFFSLALPDASRLIYTVPFA